MFVPSDLAVPEFFPADILTYVQNDIHNYVMAKEWKQLNVQQ